MPGRGGVSVARRRLSLTMSGCTAWTTCMPVAKTLSVSGGGIRLIVNWRCSFANEAPLRKTSTSIR
jgi:hypothetical protein